MIDTDGAFVPDENVSESEDGELIYELDTIRCKDVSVKGGKAIWKGRQNKRVEVAASTQAFCSANDYSDTH